MLRAYAVDHLPRRDWPAWTKRPSAGGPRFLEADPVHTRPIRQFQEAQGVDGTRTGNQIPSSPESGIRRRAGLPVAVLRARRPECGITRSRTRPAGTACRCVVMGVPAARSTRPCRRPAGHGTLELGEGGSGAWNGCTGRRRWIFDEAAGVTVERRWGAEECVAEVGEAFKTRADVLDLRQRRRRRVAGGRSAATSLVC